MSICFPNNHKSLKKNFSDKKNILHSIQLTTLLSMHSLCIFVHSIEYIQDTKEISTNFDIKDSHSHFSPIATWQWEGLENSALKIYFFQGSTGHDYLGQKNKNSKKSKSS